MADQTLDQLTDSPSAEETDNLYATRNGNSIRMKLGVALASRVPTARQVTTATGLSGGGTLSQNLTLGLDVNALTEDTTPDLAADFVLAHDASSGEPRKVRMNRVGSGTTGGTTSTPDFATVAVPNQTSIVAATPGETLTFSQGANVVITTNAASKTVQIGTSGLVPSTISIGAGQGLSGGGSLIANRSLAVDIAGQSEDTSPDLSADYVLSHDTSAGVLRKVRMSLLSSSFYTLPTATSSRLGGVRIGNGFSYDEATGILSVAPTGTSYVLPAATDAIRGGVRIGNGLTVTGDLLSNPNPTPYVLPPAGVNALGGVKQGQGVQIAADGTISATAQSTGGDGAFRPETYGAIRGAGLTQQQRESNATSINTCWTQAAAVKGRVDMGGGTWEIYGPLTLTGISNLRIEGDWCTIRQFQSGVSVVSISTGSQITLTGFMLAYQASQTSGADAVSGDTYPAALRLNSVTNCRFADIDTRNAWVHIGLSGGTGSFSNSFTNVRVNLAAGQAWGLVYKIGNGNNFINLRISGGTTVQAVTGGVYIGSVDQVAFTNLVVETVDTARAMSFVTVSAASITGGVIIGVRPRATAGFAGIVHGGVGSTIQLTGVHVAGTVLDATGQTLTDAAVFMGEDGAAFLIANMTLTGTSKSGTPRFSLIGHTTSAAAKNVTGTFQQVRLDTNPSSPHRLDDLSIATVDPTSELLVGPVLSYNSVVGDVTGGLYSIGDESLTAYPAVHGRHIQATAPLTAERTVTLSRNIDRPYASSAYSAPRTVRGATMRITRMASSTGAALLTVANHNGSSIVGLAANQSVLIVFDGTNFVMVPGSLATGGGGGEASVVYATTAEAVAGTSTTTVMNPARTKEAYNAFAAANEITGTQTQVLGFDAAGNAAAVKMTRTITVSVVAESVAVTVGTTVRRIMMPFSMKLSAIRAFLPTAGTTATTVDVNVSGTSILTTPLTVAANTSVASATAFTTASAGTITQGGVVDVDIDAAGVSARGLQVTLVGIEV